MSGDSPENRLHEARHRYAIAFLLYDASRYECSASNTLSYKSAICLLVRTCEEHVFSIQNR